MKLLPFALIILLSGCTPKPKMARECSEGELFIKHNTKYHYRECIE